MQDPTVGTGPEPEMTFSPDAKSKPWQIEIDVILHSDQDAKNPDFTIASTLPCKDPGADKPVYEFYNRGRDGFDILFRLHDQTGKGYRFPDDPVDAVWSAEDEANCPADRMHQVFKPRRVIEGGVVAVVWNENPDRGGKGIGRFAYTLNVTTDGRKPFLRLDPIGDDRNGPRNLLKR
jgi:hypothetical protein